MFHYSRQCSDLSWAETGTNIQPKNGMLQVIFRFGITKYQVWYQVSGKSYYISAICYPAWYLISKNDNQSNILYEWYPDIRQISYPAHIYLGLLWIKSYTVNYSNRCIFRLIIFKQITQRFRKSLAALNMKFLSRLRLDISIILRITFYIAVYGTFTKVFTKNLKCYDN